MTREQAMRRVHKLRAVTVQRGATPAEAATAAERAARLLDRLAAQEPARPRPLAQAYAAAARADRRSPRSLRFVGFA